jgi:hypothetical protein
MPSTTVSTDLFGLVGRFSQLALPSRILALTLVSGYVIACSDVARRGLGLVPGLAFPFRVHSFVTYAFIEDSFVSLLLTAPLAVHISNRLDPIQGNKGIALIILVAVATSGVATWLTVWLTYVLSSIFSSNAESILTMLYTPVCGFYSGVVGLLVALRQHTPGETEVYRAGEFKVMVATLPLSYVALVCVWEAVWGRMVNILPCMYGFYASWVWLRYLHPVLDGSAAGLIGDPSDQFKLLSFFPDAMQRNPKLNALCSICDTKMKLWLAEARGMWKALIAGSLNGLQGRGHGKTDRGAEQVSGSSLVGSSDEDAARRRERGMKSLEERMDSGAEAV